MICEHCDALLRENGTCPGCELYNAAVAAQGAAARSLAAARSDKAGHAWLNEHGIFLQPDDGSGTVVLGVAGEARPFVDLTTLAIEVHRNKRSLTATEIRLVTFLKERRGEWVTASEIIREVLGTHHRPDTPLVRVHVHSIRKRLGAEAIKLESDPHRKRGYRWIEPNESEES